jgi:hypothetical protein
MRIQSTSHAMQDSLALEFCGDGGRWLEIGCSYPWEHGSNTHLLENHGWSGISIDVDEKLYRPLWENSNRRTDELVFYNALEYDYSQHAGTIFDYIQIDIDPAEGSFLAAKKVLESGIRGKVITFEHDLYLDPQHEKFKNEIYDMMVARGYVRYINNVHRLDMPEVIFEDWYIDSSIDVEPTDYYLWAQNMYGKYCDQTLKLILPKDKKPVDK